MQDAVRHLADAVAARRPVDARERSSQAAFAEAIATLERPFDEHASKVHVTASAIVTSERGVALHLHKRLKIWLQPGGHIEAGETPWDAALREAVEETGLPVTFPSEPPELLHVDVHPGPRGHTHLDVRYHLVSPFVPPAPAVGESQQVRWFRWHEAVALAEPGLEGVLRALQPGEPNIRPARGSDGLDCARVYLRSRQFGIPDVPTIHDDREVKRWWADEVVGRSDVTVAELDGTIVAVMVLDQGGGGTGWIEQLYIDPAWIGRGLGERLVERAKQRFATGLQLWTFQVNDRAQRFYERLGFVEAERTDGRANEERAPDIRYTWAPASV
jgi:8-oxo-dGTP pyrophosphatase MutT (NUDIX family)/GNAT superfamily N-acetyltransferase